jgi:cytochrome c2
MFHFSAHWAIIAQCVMTFCDRFTLEQEYPMRKLILLAAILALAAMLAACGGGASDAPAAQAPAAVTGGDAAKGQELFSQSVLGGNAGCITCHSLEPGRVLVGPPMAGVATRAATTVPGESAEQYLRTSIVNTNAFLAKGCNANDPQAQCAAGIMPQDWPQKLSEQQIEDLVAYLLTLK